MSDSDDAPPAAAEAAAGGPTAPRQADDSATRVLASIAHILPPPNDAVHLGAERWRMTTTAADRRTPDDADSS